MPLIFIAPYYVVASGNCDPHCDNVVLLLPLDTNLFDETGKSVSAVGNVAVTTTAHKWGSGSAYFSSGGYLSVPWTSSLSLATTDCTVEFWIHPTAIPTEAGLVSQVNSDASWSVNLQTTGALNVSKVGVCAITTATGLVAVGQWTHVAIVREGSTTHIFVGGTLAASGTADVWTTNNNPLLVGGWTFGGTWRSFTGYLDDLRITKGVARYTPNPTKLLMHMEPQTGFVEEMGNTPTMVGSPVISTSQYKIGTSSCYFDGSSNCRFTAGANSVFDMGIQAFTVEAWVYITANQTVGICGGHEYGTNKWFLDVRNSHLNLNIVANFTSSNSIHLNQWTHVAACRNADKIYLFVDGNMTVLDIGISVAASTSTYFIVGGIMSDGSIEPFIGYIDELRISNTARYTTEFTPSLTPFVSDTSTLLLCHFEGSAGGGGAWLDVTGKSVTASGNPVLMTDTSAIGTTTTKFGSGNYLSVAGSTDLVFGTGNFTVECWLLCLEMRPTNCGNPILDMRTGVASQPSFLYVVGPSGYLGTNCFAWYMHNGQVIMTTGVTPQTGVWYHVAVVKNNNVTKIYVNGVERASAADTLDYTTGNNTILIGRIHEGDYHNGYINELRISRGVARYTTTFTPSATPHVVDAATKFLCHFDTLTGAGVPVEETGKTLTMSGNLVLTNTSAKFGTGAVWFDGVGDYLTIAGGSDFTFGTGDFTIECWCKPTSAAKSQGVFQLSGSAVGIEAGFANTLAFALYNGVMAGPQIVCANTHAGNVSVGLYVPNTWYHVVLQRKSGRTNAYLNGALVTSTADTTNYTCSNLAVGGFYNGDYLFVGGVDEFRVSKGTAIYTTSGDVLLMHFNQKHVTLYDEDTGRIFTGTAVVSNDSAVGSYSIDLTGNKYLTTDCTNNSTALGLDNFIIDFWVNPTIFSYSSIFGSWNWSTDWNWGSGNSNGWNVMMCNDGQVFLIAPAGWYSTYIIGSVNKLVLNQWNHVIITRTSGVVTFNISGNSALGTSCTQNEYYGENRNNGDFNVDMNQGIIYSQSFTYGRYKTNGGIAHFSSIYLDDVKITRVISGTPTVILANKFESSIRYLASPFIDESGKPIIVAGNATISATQSKFGGYSGYFDGTANSFFSVPYSDDFAFGADDFTIECWFWPNLSGKTDPRLFSFGAYTGNGFCVEINVANRKIGVRSNTTGDFPVYSANNVYTENMWHHLALIRKDGMVSCFLNGNSLFSPFSHTAAITITDPFYIGALKGYEANSSCTFAGYVDEFRITNGVAHYTAPFTPPTAPHTLNPYAARDASGGSLPPTAPWTYSGSIVASSNDLPPIAAFPSCLPLA